MSDCALSPHKFVNIFLGRNKSVGEMIVGTLGQTTMR